MRRESLSSQYPEAGTRPASTKYPCSGRQQRRPQIASHWVRDPFLPTSTLGHCTSFGTFEVNLTGFLVHLWHLLHVVKEWEGFGPYVPLVEASE